MFSKTVSVLGGERMRWCLWVPTVMSKMPISRYASKQWAFGTWVRTHAKPLMVNNPIHLPWSWRLWDWWTQPLERNRIICNTWWTHLKLQHPRSRLQAESIGKQITARNNVILPLGIRFLCCNGLITGTEEKERINIELRTFVPGQLEETEQQCEHNVLGPSVNSGRKSATFKVLKSVKFGKKRTNPTL